MTYQEAVTMGDPVMTPRSTAPTGQGSPITWYSSQYCDQIGHQHRRQSAKEKPLCVIFLLDVLLHQAEARKKEENRHREISHFGKNSQQHRPVRSPGQVVKQYHQ